MLRASIDIGSNSVLLLVAKVNEQQEIVEELINESYITSLGKDLDKNLVFNTQSMQDTYHALEQFKILLKHHDIEPENVIVTATEASRVAKNAIDFYKKIKKELGFNVTLISSTGEAYYTALGVCSTFPSTNQRTIVIMDIGGASSELIKIAVDPFEIISTISLPVGSVRARDWMAENTFEVKMTNVLEHDLSDFFTSNLICVAGSMTAIATMYLGKPTFNSTQIEGLGIKFKEFIKFTEDLNKTSIDNLNLLFPFLGKRAPMVGPGAIVAKIIGEKLNIEVMTISTRGLRYGTLLKGVIDERYICS